MLGLLMLNASAISPALMSRLFSISRMLRRVGSWSALKRRSIERLDD